MKDSNLEGINSQITHEMLHSDGISEIVVSLLFIIIGWSFTYDAIKIPIFAIPFIPMLIRSLRRKITWPRLGYAKVKVKGKAILMFIPAIILIFGLAGFLLSKNSGQAIQDQVFSIMSGIILILLFGFLLYRAKEEHSRLYLFIAFLLLSFCVMLYFHVPKPIIGLIMITIAFFGLCSGVYKMYNFLKKYPVLKEDE